MSHDPLPKIDATPSHLIVHVTNTDETIAFYQSLFDTPVTDDHTFAAPSLDAIFGRTGVVIRSTMIDVAGYRLHTIETLDVPRARPEYDASRSRIGITGISLQVHDLERLHARADGAGLGPTAIYEFDTELMQHAARMFFLRDPDGVGLELVEYSA